MPANKVARTGGAGVGVPRATVPNQPIRAPAAATEVPVPSGVRNASNTAVPANNAHRQLLTWVGSIVGNEVCKRAVYVSCCQL